MDILDQRERAEIAHTRAATAAFRCRAFMYAGIGVASLCIGWAVL
jgi:hypothetical protein